MAKDKAQQARDKAKELRKKAAELEEAAGSDPVYQSHKSKMAERMRRQSEEGRDIASEFRKLPETADHERRERGRQSLEAFALEYFPNRCKLPFADFHRRGLGTMQACTEAGGLFAVAWPRGSGKTALAEIAIMRAILYGFRRSLFLW